MVGRGQPTMCVVECAHGAYTPEEWHTGGEEAGGGGSDSVCTLRVRCIGCSWKFADTLSVCTQRARGHWQTSRRSFCWGRPRVGPIAGHQCRCRQSTRAGGGTVMP